MRIIAILLIFVTVGCATVDQDHPRRRHSMSEAIETGSTGGTYREHDRDDNGVLAILGILASKKEAPPENQKLETSNESTTRDDSSHFFSLGVNRSTNVGDFLDDLSRYSLIVGKRKEYVGYLFHLAMVNYDFKEEWQHSDELDDPWAIEIGFSAQRFFTDRESFLQPFVMAGIALGEMSWSFTDSIHDPTTGEKITNDSCTYLRPSVAVGMEFKISDAYSISVDFQGDYTSYAGLSTEGFDNDVLDDYWSTMWGIRLIWRF
jgi:opacity protein-like surface antigen